ncbi:hypothetical protein BD560DRAFT_339247, partial [Blakeslea trispora]
MVKNKISKPSKTKPYEKPEKPEKPEKLEKPEKQEKITITLKKNQKAPKISTIDAHMETPEPDKPLTKEKAHRITTKQRIDNSNYDILKDILPRQADISFEQLFVLVPGLQQLFNQSLRKIAHFIVSQQPINQSLMYYGDEDSTTGAYCNLTINNVVITSLIDCGASRTIMSEKLARTLGFEIDAPSHTSFTLGNNTSYASLGVIYDVPIAVGKVVIPITVEVLPSVPYDLVIGNNWLIRSKAVLSYNLSQMKLTYKKQEA